MADKKISALTGATTPLAGTEVLPIVQSGATVKVAVSDLTAGRAVSATQLTSTIAIGTAPLVVTSTTNVANLNASSLNGATFAAPGAIGGGTASAITGTTITGTDATDASSTTAAAIKTAGGFAVVKKIYVGDNIVPATAAKGINFTANTALAGMTSQLLNKYEEGTFTPFISFGGGTTGITYFARSGLYTRVGRVVTVSGSIYIDSKGSSTGVFELNGLPYNSSGYAVVLIAYRNGVTYTGQLQAYLNASEARVTISTISAVGVETNLTNTAVAAGTQFYFSCTYHG